MTAAFRLRYAAAVLRRFRITLAFMVLLVVVLPLIYVWQYHSPALPHIDYGHALHHVYFLLFGQPSLEYVDIPLLTALDIIIPPLGIATVVDGGVRFGYLFFAKHKAEREWIEVIAEALKGHVVVCGAGRVGYRVTLQLLELKHPVLVIENRPDAHFVSTLRDMNVPVLIDDVRNPLALKRLNLESADAIICATNDDLANLNVALDARRFNPRLRIVLRLFDDDLVERVKENFRAEAHSTSALAAPAFALTALDPRIMNSFHVGPHLMVVSRFEAREKLTGLRISDVRDQHGGLCLGLKRPGAEEQLHPPGAVQITSGDVLTVQLRYDEYRALRAFTGEQLPPLSSAAT
ncbi:MAG: NAD-binding protein [Archangiaceae bacterium]|nr:NAD-binding protein [Archangiaceae bacterium]